MGTQRSADTPAPTPPPAKSSDSAAQTLVLHNDIERYTKELATLGKELLLGRAKRSNLQKEEVKRKVPYRPLENQINSAEKKLEELRQHLEELKEKQRLDHQQEKLHKRRLKEVNDEIKEKQARFERTSRALTELLGGE